MRGRIAVLALAGVVGCGAESADSADAPTYYSEAKAVVDARCATCHTAGDIGPFPLTTYQEVLAFSVPVRASIENGTMPPWMPSDECRDYEGSIALTAEEEALLLAWLDAGAPEGDPADAPDDASGGDEDAFEADLLLQMPEPYTPIREPDDYRCQLIPWPAEDTRYVTGLRVNPDQRAIVHHVIAFVIGPDQVEQFQAYDDAEEGPGYTCYGGPRGSEGGTAGSIDIDAVRAALEALGLTLADLQAGNLTDEEIASLITSLGGLGGFMTIGSWVPGTPALPYPEGTGIRVEPGSMIVAQVHYNTISSDPTADQSTIEVATAASVEREAATVPVLDLGWVTNGLFGEPMTIPAGAASVEHATTVAADSMFFADARQKLGLTADDPVVVHSANHHMHELGTSQRSEVQHADSTTSCLLDIPEWDFAWQGSYTFAEPVTVQPDDVLWMGCTWDNSAANQPTVDGEVREPTDVSWGEGTSDEMCLGSFYVTAQ